MGRSFVLLLQGVRSTACEEVTTCSAKTGRPCPPCKELSPRSPRAIGASLPAAPPPRMTPARLDQDAKDSPRVAPDSPEARAATDHTGAWQWPSLRANTDYGPKPALPGVTRVASTCCHVRKEGRETHSSGQPSQVAQPRLPFPPGRARVIFWLPSL